VVVNEVIVEFVVVWIVVEDCVLFVNDVVMELFVEVVAMLLDELFVEVVAIENEVLPVDAFESDVTEVVRLEGSVVDEKVVEFPTRNPSSLSPT